MKNTGILRIQAFGARQSSPIEGVLVTVSGNGFTAQRITDETGTAADLSIEAPSCALSLQEDNTIRPYAVVQKVMFTELRKKILQKERARKEIQTTRLRKK